MSDHFTLPTCNTLNELLKEYVSLYGKTKWAINGYSSYYFQIHLRHLLAPFPRLRPLIPLSVALLRCVPFALASAKNSLRILAHSHLEIV